MANISQIEQITATSLIEELKSPESKTKINAIRNLRRISFALGRERTRKELLPFLVSCIDEEEDEILIELAKILSNFIDCIGGKQYISELFNILETLLCVDEQNIRKEAINSIKCIVKEINNISEIENYLIDIINRLGNSENENQKISCINLICFIYNLLNENNKNICNNLIKSFTSENESIIIKKELANTLPNFIIYLGPTQIKEIINSLISDQNDNIKMTLMDIIIALKNYKNLDELIDFIISILTKLSSEEKWRIRLSVGDKICDLLDIPKTPNNLNIINKIKMCIIDIFDNYISDKESEIKNIVCIKLDILAEKIIKDSKDLSNNSNSENQINANSSNVINANTSNTIDKILKNLKVLTKDQASYVRGALAGNILKISPIIGMQKTNEFIIPIFLELLKDENHDIRITLIKTLHNLNQVIKIDEIILSIIPSFIEISTNKSWRIRIQIFELISIFSTILNKALFIEKIFPICINSLTDPVFAIREAASKIIKELYAKFDDNEFEKSIIDKLNEMSNSKSYLVRNTVVLFIKIFVEGNDVQKYINFIEKKLFDLLVRLSKDKISNVRMNCACVFVILKKISNDKNIINTINGCIEVLKKDSDNDVIKMLNGNSK